MSAYKISAERWDGGWELHIEGVGVTQSRTLDGAEKMIRSYLKLDNHADWHSAEIAIAPKLDGLEGDAADSRAQTEAASTAQLAAAARARSVAHDLRAKGLSVSDMAFVLGVSRGRVSQLVKT